jgi:hypothetical protein
MSYRSSFLTIAVEAVTGTRNGGGSMAKILPPKTQGSHPAFLRFRAAKAFVMWLVIYYEAASGK